MWRGTFAGLIVALMTLLVGAATAGAAPHGVATGSPPVVPPVSSTTQITVSPSLIGPRTDVVLHFEQPQTTGLTGEVHDAEALRVTGPAATGCVIGANLDLPSADQGTQMSPTLRPGHFDGSHWCTGRYTVQLDLYQFPRCSISPVRACPMYVVLPRVLATAHFRVGAR